MFEELKELYTQSGAYADPILISTLALFLVGSVMLFTVRLVKRFILFSLVALLLPNSIGVVATFQETEDLKEAITERGEELSEEVSESIEDFRFSPLYLSLLGSAACLVLAGVGMTRARKHKQSPEQSKDRAS